MKLEILLSTMDQNDFSIIRKNNISSDIIIINQTNKVEYRQKEYSDFTAEMYSFNERGIGKSRNDALMRSTADICLIADDDVVYYDNYEKIILNEFKKNPNVDMILFDLNFIDHNKQRNKNEKINKLNFMKHGGPKIAFRRSSIIRNNIYFSLLFGGGAKYGSGEDSLFIKNAVDSNLNVISVDKKIGDISSNESTWFTGFNEKYLFDRGALFKALFPRHWPMICIQFIIRHNHKFQDNKSIVYKFNIMKDGARNFSSI